MKKFFLAALAVATIAMVGCKPKPGPEPPTPGEDSVTTADAPVFNAVDGQYVIVIDIQGNVCDGGRIAFPNGSKLKPADASAWEEDLAAIDYMTPVTTDDNGTDWSGKNWYVVKIAYGDSLQAKPVFIPADAANLDWSYQSGDKNAWKVISGNVEITDGYADEANLTFLTPGVHVMQMLYWKKKVNPCDITSYATVTWTISMPEATYPDSVTVVPFIHGNFDGWAAGHEMTKVSDNVYTFTYNDVADGCEYQYTLNGDWNYKAIHYDAEFNYSDANYVVTGAEMTDAPAMFAKNAPAPESDEVWIKCAGNSWTAAQMTETATAGTFTYETTITDAGNIGANIGVDEAMTGAEWYDLGNAESKGLATGDAVVYTFVQNDGVKGELTVAKK